MINFIRRINRYASIRLRNSMEVIPWRFLSLNYSLNSALTIYIKNRADWNTYNELFIRKDYDQAIDKSFTTISKQSTFNFLDLGANVGFFTYRLMNAILESGYTHTHFKGILVEGSPRVFKELSDRFKHVIIPNIELETKFGLVGKKSGSSKIYESSNYITNSVSTNSSLRSRLGGKKVDYINIDEFFDNVEYIDLLKCDIEGSEMEFLIHYPELMRKVKVAVFEMHHERCDTKKCLELLKDAGFSNRKVLSSYGESLSLEMFWK